jgi:hypothetical protein
MKSEAGKRAQKKYDLAHKEDVKRIDIKINKERYKAEIELLDSMESRQKFLLWLVTEFLNNEGLQKKWQEEEKRAEK